MPDIQAHLADGTTLHFPDGTDPNVIQGVVKRQVTPMQSGAMQTRKGGPVTQAPASAQWSASPTPPQPGMMRKTLGGAKEFGGGMLDPIKSLPQFAEAQNPDSVLGSWPEKQVGEGQDYLARAKQALSSGDLMSFIGHSLNAALAPTMLPQTVEGLSQTAETNPLRAAGQLTGMAAMEKAPEKIAGIPESMRTGAQDTLGIGKNFIQQGAEKVGESNAELVGKHAEQTQEALAGQKAKIDQARISEPQTFAEAETKHQKQVQTAQQASAESQAGFNQRQQHIDIANQHAQTISDRLPQVYQEARKEAGAAYGPQPKGTFDSAELKTAIEDAAQSKLQGNSKLPTAVSKIISDIDKPPAPTELEQASVFRGAGKAMRGQGKGYSAGDALADMDPKAKQKYLAGLSEPERAQLETPQTTAEKIQPLDAKRIHGFMSELGKAARSGSLSGDEAASINATRYMLEGRLRKLYDNEGRLGDFQKGQAAWKQMANTFENQSMTAKGGSPIARALATEDPITGKLRPDYVRSILSDDKAFSIAQEQLGRYSHLGAPTNEMDVMKTNGDFAETLPSKVKWRVAPEGPKYPNFTEFGNLPKTQEPPTLESFDPIEARKVALKQKSSSLAGTGGPYGVMRDVMGMKGALTGNPMALSYPILRRILGGSVGNESLMKWLSKATPEEMEMAKDIPASKVTLKRAKNP